MHVLEPFDFTENGRCARRVKTGSKAVKMYAFRTSRSGIPFPSTGSTPPMSGSRPRVEDGSTAGRCVALLRPVTAKPRGQLRQQRQAQDQQQAHHADRL